MVTHVDPARRQPTPPIVIIIPSPTSASELAKALETFGGNRSIHFVM